MWRTRIRIPNPGVRDTDHEPANLSDDHAEVGNRNAARNVTEWHAVPGKSIVKGEPIVDVETDKIVNSVEAPVSGGAPLDRRGQGAVENVGALIAVFADPSVPDAEIEAFVRGFKPADTSFEPGESTASAGIAGARSRARFRACRRADCRPGERGWRHRVSTDRTPHRGAFWAWT